RDVAVLSLEGRPPLPEDRYERPRVRAVLPKYAGDLLARLVGPGKPYDDVQQFRTDAAAYSDRPAEVTSYRRAPLRALLSAFLAFAMCGCMVPAAWMPGLVAVLGLRHLSEDGRQVLRDLDEGAHREAAIAAVNADPWVRLCGAAQLHADLELRDRLKRPIVEADPERQARTAASGLL